MKKMTVEAMKTLAMNPLFQSDMKEMEKKMRALPITAEHDGVMVWTDTIDMNRNYMLTIRISRTADKTNLRIVTGMELTEKEVQEHLSSIEVDKDQTILSLDDKVPSYVSDSLKQQLLGTNNKRPDPTNFLLKKLATENFEDAEFFRALSSHDQKVVSVFLTFYKTVYEKMSMKDASVDVFTSIFQKLMSDDDDIKSSDDYITFKTIATKKEIPYLTPYQMFVETSRIFGLITDPDIEIPGV